MRMMREEGDALHRSLQAMAACLSSLATPAPKQAPTLLGRPGALSPCQCQFAYLNHGSTVLHFFLTIVSIPPHPVPTSAGNDL